MRKRSHKTTKLSPDAYSKLEVCQTAFAAGDPHRIPLEELTLYKLRAVSCRLVTRESIALLVPCWPSFSCKQKKHRGCASDPA